MPFITKIDLSDNRQAIQNIKTITDYSGTSIIGTTFSDLPSGPDFTTSGITSTIFPVESTFTATTTAMTFTYGNPYMSSLESELTLITSGNSGTTQFVGPSFSADSSTTIDGNNVDLSFSGISYYFSVDNADLIGSTIYGTGTSSVSLYSADTLDYTGSTEWLQVKGGTGTEKLRVSEGAVTGYALIAVNGDGDLEYQAFGSASTLWSASTGTNSLVPVDGANTASGDYSLAGGGNSTASGTSAFAWGAMAFATGDSSFAFGSSPNASGIGSVCFGPNIVTGDNSFSVGGNNNVSGQNSAAFGGQTVASGNQSFVAGSSSNATGIASTAFGGMCTAAGNSSFAAGNGSSALGSSSTVFGSTSIAFATGSFAGGNFGSASGSTSFAYGDVVVSDSDRSVALGGYFNWIQSGATNGSIIGGTGNTLTNSAINSTILGGVDVTGTSANTTYVSELNISTVPAGPATSVGVDGTGSLAYEASDRTLKENITTIESALDKVRKLRGVTFDWINKEKGGADSEMGFIAQEVQGIVPELAFQIPNSTLLGVKYNHTVALLVEAIKELTSGTTTQVDTIVETQRVVAEDNNIELNYKGTKESSVDGGIIVKDGISEGVDAKFVIDEDGTWNVTPKLKTPQIVIESKTPTSSEDSFGEKGQFTWDDDYLYMKTNNGWKRTGLENF